MSRQSAPPNSLTATQLGLLLAVVSASIIAIAQVVVDCDLVVSYFYILFTLAALYYVLSEYELEDTGEHQKLQTLTWVYPKWSQKAKEWKLLRSFKVLRMANLEFSLRVLLTTVFGVVLAYPEDWMGAVRVPEFRLWLMAGNHWLMLCWDVLIITFAAKAESVKWTTLFMDTFGLFLILGSLLCRALSDSNWSIILLYLLFLIYFFGIIPKAYRLLAFLSSRLTLR